MHAHARARKAGKADWSAQQAFNQTQKKVEEYESSSPRVEQSSEMLRLQELEMENVKLKEDMTRLRSAIVDSDGDNEAVREMAEQYENIQEEYDRVKVECLQLKTVLANVQLSGSLESGEPGSLVSDNADDVMMAYETQKKVIQQLQASLNQEKVRAVRAERETRAELEKLRALSSEQQTVIQTNMNKSPTNQTEAYMQHELTRLTGENFDLREKIEILNDTIKRLKKQLKMYMKKLQENGVMQALDEEKDVEVGDSEQSMPVIIKKEHDNLGMLEYNKEQEDKLLRVIITELKPRLASQMLPGLPAYILFMLIRHLDHINDDKNVRSLIQGAISQVKKTIKKRADSYGSSRHGTESHPSGTVVASSPISGPFGTQMSSPGKLLML